MPETQTSPVSAPIETDTKFLGFATIIQQNLFDLFNYAHTHTTITTAPTASQGTVGDIIIVQLGTTYYLYAKVTKTKWLRTLLS